MKKNGLLNASLIEKIASIGHTQHLTIADAGLPVPEGVPCIDLAVTAGIPGFLDVLQVVSHELIIESYVVASELRERRPKGLQEIQEVMGDLPYEEISHEAFKEMTRQTCAIVRTGETEAFANIILVAGVNF